MDRRHLSSQRPAPRSRGTGQHGHTAAASALVSGCLAVAALWKSAATSAAPGDVTRR